MKTTLILESLRKYFQRDINEKRVFRFGLFHFDLDTGELSRNGISLKLQPQPSKVLSFLLSRPGELVTRKEIQDRVWEAGTFVDFEQGLNWCIRRVREALDDNASTPKYVQTVARRGYRFIGESVRDGGMRHVSSPSHWYSKRSLIWASMCLLILALTSAGFRIHNGAGASRTKISIIVVPFQNTTGDPNSEYLADSMTDEILNGLARLDPQHIKVVSRTTSMQLKDAHLCANEIGRDFRVDYLLEGSVNRFSSGIRVTAQLIRAADQEQVWADAGNYGDPALPNAFSRLTQEAVSSLVRRR
jgi:TolB-like protein/DNA-binding winged helix-turn-helix (wHTH) protein